MRVAPCAPATCRSAPWSWTRPGQVLAAAGNAREASGDPTAHAEVLALRAAAGEFGDGWRLTGCTLVVTVEPCTMCAGALVLARVARLVFGAWEPRTGAVGSLWDVVRDRRSLHRPEVVAGVLAKECESVMAEFFRTQRFGPGEGRGPMDQATRPTLE